MLSCLSLFLFETIHQFSTCQGVWCVVCGGTLCWWRDWVLFLLLYASLYFSCNSRALRPGMRDSESWLKGTEGPFLCVRVTYSFASGHLWRRPFGYMSLTRAQFLTSQSLRRIGILLIALADRLSGADRTCCMLVEGLLRGACLLPCVSWKMSWFWEESFWLVYFAVGWVSGKGKRHPVSKCVHWVVKGGNCLCWGRSEYAC